MLGIVKALPSGYSRDLQDFKPALFDTSTIALEAIKIMSGVVSSLKINKTRMHEAANTSYAIALDVAEQLVKEHKLPFRSAHKIVGALVDKAANLGNIPLGRLSESDISSALMPDNSNITADQLATIIREMTPEKSLEDRKSSGSPNLGEQEDMIQSLSHGISNYKVGIEKRKKMVAVSFDNLSKTIEKYL
jgi:argininosuccinate lyase